MDSFGQNKRKYFDRLGASPSRPIPSIKKPLVLEEKQFPSHLRYAYLGESSTLPVIILSYLSKVEEDKLLRVLREHQETIGWSLANKKVIRPSMCMHRILLEDDSRTTIEAQRKLNPTMKEVVREEVLKWLDARVIYPIYDNPWVIPVQVVPKKGGMEVIKNENNELIQTRTTSG